MNSLAAIDAPHIIFVVVIVGAALFLQGLTYPWIRAKLGGVPISMAKLMAMQLRKVPCGQVVDANIVAVKVGVALNYDCLEAHYLAGGNLTQCVQALILAKNANLDLDWNKACAIDLACKGTGQTIVSIINTSLETKQPFMDVFNGVRKSMGQPTW